MKLIERVLATGFSRHTAVPALGALGSHQAKSFTRQLLALFAGSSLIGIAVALLVHADLGLTPYDVMSSAVSERLGISLGQAGWLMAAVLFGMAAVFRHRPSRWGVAYILANGLAIDAASGLLTRPDTLAGRWVFVVSAVVILAAGVSLVVYSGTTGGPFELLTLAGEDRGVSRTTMRYALDLGVFVGGVALGGAFGPATVFFALAFGLVLRIISQALVDHGQGREARLLDGDRPVEASRSSSAASAPVLHVPSGGRPSGSRTSTARRSSGRRPQRSGV